MRHFLGYLGLVLVLASCGTPKQEDPDSLVTDIDANNTTNNIENNANNQPNDPCAAGSTVLDDSIVHQIELTMSDADWAAMHDEKAASPEYGGPPKIYRPANLTFDGVELGSPVGLRLKGHYSLITAEGRRYPLKVDFNRIDDGQKFESLGKLNLHPSGEEHAGALNETLSYGSLRDHGVVAPRTAFAQLTINGESLGLYNLVEQIDGRFIKCHFAEPYGQLYKPEEGDGNLGTVQERFSDYETIEHKWPKEPDHTSFLNMISVINQGDLNAFPDVLNMTGVFTYFAANTGVGSPDTYASTGHNYYLYEETPGKFTMIPWDLNISQFGDDGPCGIPGRNGPEFPLSHYPLGDEGYVDEYKTILLDFLEGEGSADALIERLDAAVALVESAGETVEIAEDIEQNIVDRTDGLGETVPELVTCP